MKFLTLTRSKDDPEEWDVKQTGEEEGICSDLQDYFFEIPEDVKRCRFEIHEKKPRDRNKDFYKIEKFHLFPDWYDNLCLTDTAQFSFDREGRDVKFDVCFNDRTIEWIHKVSSNFKSKSLGYVVVTY